MPYFESYLAQNQILCQVQSEMKLQPLVSEFKRLNIRAVYIW